MVQHVIGEDEEGKRNEGAKRNVGVNLKHKHSKMVGPSEGGKSIRRPIEWKQSLEFN